MKTAKKVIALALALQVMAIVPATVYGAYTAFAPMLCAPYLITSIC